MAKLVTIIEAPEWVDVMFKHWNIDETGKQKVWQSFIEHMVGVEPIIFPIYMQAYFGAYTNSIKESGELDEILGN
jgi:hypothetical protein